MTELKEEHFEVIDSNKDKTHNKKTYRPLPDNLFIEESLINGQGLFASNDIPSGTDLGVSHVEIEKDKMSPKELIRTPLGGFINHEPIITEVIRIDEDTTKTIEVSGPNCERKKIDLMVIRLNGILLLVRTSRREKNLPWSIIYISQIKCHTKIEMIPK